MTESYKQLYSELRDSDFACIPPGFYETADVYDLVREEYHSLCDDSILCRDTCSTSSDQSERKHRVRTVQQALIRRRDTHLQRLSEGWYYSPTEIDVEEVPNDPIEFQVGTHYNRWQLHDVFGGQRYSGIATPAEYQLVFLFTSNPGEAYGYEMSFSRTTPSSTQARA